MVDWRWKQYVHMKFLTALLTERQEPEGSYEIFDSTAYRKTGAGGKL
jgi:hypothetical protein